MQDAIPFRKHIRAGIEHGDQDTVPENAWTLAYYYYQPTARAELTDQLDVGNAASETAHAYEINGQTWSGSHTYSYDGNADKVNITDNGRAHKGTSQFKMTLAPANMAPFCVAGLTRAWPTSGPQFTSMARSSVE